MAEKKVFQARIDPKIIDLLKQLAEKEKRTIGATFEIIVQEAAVKAGLIK